MKQSYRYDKKMLIIKYVPMLIFILMAYVTIITIVGTPTNNGATGSVIYDISLFVFMAIPIISIIAWIINMMTVRLCISEYGVKYESLIRKIDCKWNDIVIVDAVNYHSGGIPGYYNKVDLKIVLKNDKIIKIFNFIKNENGEVIDNPIGQLKVLIEKNINS